MGSNQAKTAPSPMLPPVSCALSCQENQEQHIRNGIPRRVGSMVLSHWIQMKRREQAILERARRAVSEGQAPPEVLEKVEKQLAKESRRYHIKYHPRILVRKPKRPRLKAPKLTNTAARRIQASFQRREKEQEEATQVTKKQTRSRNNVKSQGWTQSLHPDHPGGSQTSRERRKRSSSVPPSSTLSLQSITTAESSGIGMSRASSVTSVASSRHKTLYTRQRVRSLEEDGKLLEELRELQLRHQSKTPVQGACSDSNRRSQGEASGRHKCKAAERHAQQQIKLEEQPEQQIRRVPRRHKADEQSLEQQPRSKTHTPKHWEQPQHHDHERKTSQRQRTEQQRTPQQENQQKASQKPMKKHLSQTGKTEKPPSHQHQKNQATSAPRQDGQQHPSNHQRDNNQDKRERRRPRKEKKDQGSQTRMSGPPRPRRLLVTQQLKKQTRSSQEQPRTRFRLSDDLTTDNSSSDTQTNSAASHGKQVSRTVQSGTNKEQGRNSTSSRERSRGLNTSHENSQQVPTLTRRKSYIDLDDLNIESHQHKRLVNTENERPNQQLDPGTKTKVQLIQHQVQVHHGALRDAPQSHQQEDETQRSHQQERHPSDHSHPAPHVNQHNDQYAEPPEQFANPQESEQSIPKTKVARQEAEVLKPKNSESQTQSDQNRKSAHDRQLQDGERTVAAQGGGRHVAPSGRGRSGGPHGHEAQPEGHSGRSLERQGTIKSQGGESLTRQSQREYTVESQSGMRSRSSERGHPSASTDRRQTRSSLERAHPGPSLEGGRDLTDEKQQRHQAVKYPSVEHVNGERTAEHVHHDPLLQSFRSVPSSLHRMHHELPARFVHRARVVEYTRHEPSLDRLRQDMRAGHQPYIEIGRAGSAVHREHSISYTERGHRLYPVRDRYTSGARDHGYTSDTSDSGRIRLYGERRYDGGYVDASHAGSYSEYTTRSLEPSYPRLYSDRALYRSEETDHARPYSERSHAGKSLEPYPDRILSERWRHTGEWEDREKGHYKEMVTPLNASTQPLDHRAL